MNNIKTMVEQGFACKKIIKILNLPQKDVKEIIKNNNYQIIKEDFTEDKIKYICDLYQQGVAAKSLGIKFSIDKRRVLKWVKNIGILRNKADSHRITFFNDHIFDKIDTPAKAYWLGFFYADAYNCKRTNTVSLSLQTDDLNHLQKLAQFIDLPQEKIFYTKNKEGHEYYTLKMYSKHLCQELNNKGCPQAKSFIITYPKWLNKELYIHFIRGIFDGDGSICKRIANNEWKWSLATTKECGESIQQIVLDQLKMIVNLRYISKTEHNTYELESNGNEKVLKLMEWLYKDLDINEDNLIFLERKYQKYLELIDQQNNRKFSRTEYKISEETKSDIIQQFKDNDKLKMVDVALEHNIHPRTVSKILNKTNS